jgi:large subunit ribosomal protein L14e
LGRVCVKIRGRDAGRKCVIVNIIDKNYVVVTGPKSLTGVRRRKVNVDHLIFLPHVLKISKNASDSEVLQSIEKENLISFFREGVVIDAKKDLI